MAQVFQGPLVCERSDSEVSRLSDVGNGAGINVHDRRCCGIEFNYVLRRQKQICPPDSSVMRTISFHRDDPLNYGQMWAQHGRESGNVFLQTEAMHLDTVAGGNDPHLVFESQRDSGLHVGLELRNVQVEWTLQHHAGDFECQCASRNTGVFLGVQVDKIDAASVPEPAEP